MDPINVALGESVREAIADAKLTQNYVAEQVDITPSCWDRRIAGKSPFKAPELFRIAQVISRKASAIVAETEGRLS